MLDLQRFRDGDRSHLDDVVRQYGGLVRTVIRPFAHGPDDEEDLFQQVWLRVLMKRESYSGQGSFEAWLRRLALNACRSWARRNTERAASSGRATRWGVLASFHWEAPDPLETMVSEEELGRLAASIQGLPPQERRAVELRFLQGCRAREIAAELGIEESTARATVRSALRHLRLWREE